MVSALGTELGIGVALYSFQWSGRNVVGARTAASTHLSKALASSIRRLPAATHSVIAHSHGGAVALRAVEAPGLGNVKVVCLSTPLIHAVYRRRVVEAKNFISFLAFFPTFGLLVILGYLDDQGFLKHNQPLYSWLEYAFYPATILLCLLFFWFLKISLKHANKLVAAMSFSEHTHGRVLFIRFTSDEASLALNVFQAAQTMLDLFVDGMFKVFAMFSSVFAWAKKHERQIWHGLLWPFLAGLLLWGFLSDGGHKRGYDWIAFLAFPAIYSFAAFVLGLLIVVLMAGGAMVFAMGSTVVGMIAGIVPLDPRLALAHLWVELSVEALPAGRPNVLVLEPELESRFGGLRHGFAYQDVRAVKAIINYVRH